MVGSIEAELEARRGDRPAGKAVVKASRRCASSFGQRARDAPVRLVPNCHPRSRGCGAHTKSSAHKAIARAREAVGVRFEGCHLTRHAMINWARRVGARADVLERVTHNATGAIIGPVQALRLGAAMRSRGLPQLRS